MSLLLIKTKDMRSENGFMYQKLFIFKLFTLIVGTALAIAFLSAESKELMGARGFMLLFLGLFSAIFILVRDEKTYKYGAAAFCISALSLLTAAPFKYEFYALTPMFQQWPIAPILIYAILGKRWAIASSGYLLIILILFMTGVLAPKAMPYLPEIDLYTRPLFRGRIIALVFVFLLIFTLDDIKEAIKAELALKKAKLHNIETYDILRKIAAGMSHEINNPLAIANGFAGQLSSASEDEVFLDKITKINAAHKRIQDIVLKFQPLLNFSAGQATEQNLYDLVNRSLITKNDHFRPEIKINKALTIETNPFLLKEVITIITDNAYKAVKDLPSKIVTWRAEKGALVCFDNGPGFTDKSFEECLSPFSSGLEKSKSSLGLGLFHAHIICGKLGARLEHERSENLTKISIVFDQRFFSK